MHASHSSFVSFSSFFPFPLFFNTSLGLESAQSAYTACAVFACIQKMKVDGLLTSAASTDIISSSPNGSAEHLGKRFHLGAVGVELNYLRLFACPSILTQKIAS